MYEGKPQVSRRAVMRGAAVLALGSVAVGATTGSVLGVPLVSGAAGTRSATLHVWGRDFYLGGRGHRQGQVPADGERGTVYGDLLDAPNGTPVGRFNAACFFTDAESDNLELHTFHLPGGMLVGMGSTAEGAGTCAILGGTGRYAGATGTYVARQGLREVGGDGSAEFVITLTA